MPGISKQAYEAVLVTSLALIGCVATSGIIAGALPLTVAGIAAGTLVSSAGTPAGTVVFDKISDLVGTRLPSQWFTEELALNDAVSPALGRAFAKANEEVRRKWKQQAHYSYLYRSNKPEAQSTLQALDDLGSSVTQLFSVLKSNPRSVEQYGVLELLRTGQARAIKDLLQKELKRNLSLYDSVFVDYVEQHLPEKLVLFFELEVKSNSSEGQSASKAFHDWLQVQILSEIRSISVNLQGVQAGVSALLDVSRAGSKPPTDIDKLLAGGRLEHYYDQIVSPRVDNSTPRDWAFQQIHEWLEVGVAKVLLVIGSPGTGKTALAGQLYYYSSGKLPALPEARILSVHFLAAAHFNSADYSPTLVTRRMAESLARQLSIRYTVFHDALLALLDHVTAQTNDVDFWDAVIVQPITKLREQTVVILIDGLDEVLKQDDGRLLELLRSASLPNVRWLLTSRDLYSVRANFPDAVVVSLDGPAAQKDVTAYITQRLDLVRPVVEVALRDRFTEVLSIAARGNFLYARYVLEDSDVVQRLLKKIRALDPEELLDISRFRRRFRNLLPARLTTIYGRFVSSLKTQVGRSDSDTVGDTLWRTLYLPLLQALAIAQGEGIDHVSLSMIVGKQLDTVSNTLEDDRFVPYLKSEGGLYRFYHQSFAEFLTTTRTGNSFWIYPSDAHWLVINKLSHAAGPDWSDATLYALGQLPSHLMELIGYFKPDPDVPIADQWQHDNKIMRATERLEEILSDLSYLATRISRNHGDTWLLEQDYERAELLIADNTIIKTIANAVQQESGRLREHPAHAYNQIYNRLHQSQEPGIQQLLAASITPMGTFLLAHHRLPANTTLRRELYIDVDRQPMAAVAISSDGHWALSGARDGRIVLWDLLHGRLIHSLNVGHEAAVSAITLEQSNSFAVSGDRSGGVYCGLLTAADSWQFIGKHKGWVQAVTIDSSGETVLSVGSDLKIRRWNRADGELLQHWDFGDFLGTDDDKLFELEAAALTPDGHYALLALAANPPSRAAIGVAVDYFLLRWDLSTNQPSKRLTAHNRPLRALSITSEGRWGLAAGDDGHVRLWDLESNELLRDMAAHETTIWSLAVTVDCSHAVSGAQDHCARLWDLKNGTLLHTLAAHRSDIAAVSITSDGRWVLTCGDEGTICLWEPGDEVPISQLNPVWIVAMPQTKDFALVGGEDTTLQLLDLKSGETTSTPTAHMGRVQALAIAPDGTWAASGSVDGTVCVWNLLDQLRSLTLPEINSSVTALAIAPDGGRILVGTVDGSVLLWRRESAEELLPLDRHSGPVTSVAFNLDGLQAVSCAEADGLRRCDLCSGATDCGPIMDQPSLARTLALTPEGRYGIFAGADGVLRRWNLATGALAGEWLGHSGEIRAIAVTADGGWLASASEDRTVRLWDLRRRQNGPQVACFTWDVPFCCLAVGGDPLLLIAGDERGRLLFLKVTQST